MVALRRLTRRVEIQSATFTQDAIGQQAPTWTTYARPFAERRRASVPAVIAGAATRVSATVYRFRAVEGLIEGQQLIDGANTHIVGPIRDIDGGFVEVQVS